MDGRVETDSTLLLLRGARHGIAKRPPGGGHRWIQHPGVDGGHCSPLTPWDPVDHFILYLVLPVGRILVLLRESPTEYGLQIGDRRTGLKLTAAGIAGGTPPVWPVMRGSDAMRDYSAWQAGPDVVLKFTLDLTGWEYRFRG